MAKHGSASVRTETPHANNTQRKAANRDLKRKQRRKNRRQPLTDDVKRRALAIINNKAIDAQIRGVIRYGYDINDPWTPDLVRRVEAGGVHPR